MHALRRKYWDGKDLMKLNQRNFWFYLDKGYAMTQHLLTSPFLHMNKKTAVKVSDKTTCSVSGAEKFVWIQPNIDQIRCAFRLYAVLEEVSQTSI